MAYNGIIKKSKTFDALAVMTVMTATQPLLMDVLQGFALSPKWVSLTNLLFVGWLAYLRFNTSGAIGTEGPPGEERRGSRSP